MKSLFGKLSIQIHGIDKNSTSPIMRRGSAYNVHSKDGMNTFSLSNVGEATELSERVNF